MAEDNGFTQAYRARLPSIFKDQIIKLATIYGVSQDKMVSILAFQGLLHQQIDKDIQELTLKFMRNGDKGQLVDCGNW